MPRLSVALFSASLALLSGIGAPVLAETDAERAARCTGQANIVSRAVELRADGADQGAATSRLEASDSGIDPKYAPSISVLVGWIYTLPVDQLTPETSIAFQTQCLGYKP